MSELWDAAMERANHRCEFPKCTLPTTFPNPLEVAHLKGKQMGGSKYRNHIDNLAVLCKFHHQWLDTGPRFENEMAARGFLDRWWKERR